MEKVKHWKIWSDDSDNDIIFSNKSDADDTEINFEKKSSKKKKKHKRKRATKKNESVVKKHKKSSDHFNLPSTISSTQEDLSEEENELIAKEPISTNKKSFVFNINLENSNLDISYQDANVISKNTHQQLITDSPEHSKKSNKEITLEISKLSKISNSTSTKSALNAISVKNQFQSSISAYNAHNSSPSTFSNIYQLGPSQGLNEKKLLHSQNSSNVDINYSTMHDFTTYALPPLPTDNEPVKPPEPTFDFKRLSNQKIIEMFISQDITKESLRNFFEDKEIDYIPSPASSFENDVNDNGTKNDIQSDKQAKENNLDLQDSYSSRSDSETHSYSSENSRRSSWSSGQSHSYFSTTSNESDNSYTSSDTDISRPCRHYRPGKKHRHTSSHSRSCSNSISSHTSSVSE